MSATDPDRPDEGTSSGLRKAGGHMQISLEGIVATVPTPMYVENAPTIQVRMPWTRAEIAEREMLDRKLRPDA